MKFQLRHFIRTPELLDEVQLDDDLIDHNASSGSNEEEFYSVEDVGFGK